MLEESFKIRKSFSVLKQCENLRGSLLRNSFVITLSVQYCEGLLKVISASSMQAACIIGYSMARMVLVAV